jgi:two-component system nitrogen regulation response regulator GlnG
MAAQGIVGESGAILNVFRLVMRISPLSNFPVLITGESGTGKELIANAIHRLDPVRQRGPFLPLNCSTVTHELAESELFGHRRGAFTGADRDRKGLFRSADGGILFLDEIAELDERLQAKLLRVLQEQRVLGLGEDVETRVDVRVIAATNADLHERVRQGRFRADLLNRLNALAVHVPPLRERSEDIKSLAEHFLERHGGLRGDERPVRASDEFMQALTRVELAGNVRQLENLIRSVLLNKTDDTPLSLRDLPRAVWEQLSREGVVTDVRGAAERVRSTAEATSHAEDSVLLLLQANRWSMTQSIAECERLILRAALEHECGNQTRAARLLGITPRSVYNKLRKHSHHLASSATSGK